MTHEHMSEREGAALFLALLERAAWVLSLTAQGELHVVVGDDDPPRWPQQKIFAVLDALAPEIIALLAARDGLDHIDGGSAVH